MLPGTVDDPYVNSSFVPGHTMNHLWTEVEYSNSSSPLDSSRKEWAHCTCMAGLGEACSHISALLFAAEPNTQMRKNVSCTYTPCSWLAPSIKAAFTRRRFH